MRVPKYHSHSFSEVILFMLNYKNTFLFFISLSYYTMQSAEEVVNVVAPSPVKKKNFQPSRAEPQRDAFTTEREYQRAYEKWQQHRTANNKSVQQYRSRGTDEEKEARRIHTNAVRREYRRKKQLEQAALVLKFIKTGQTYTIVPVKK